MFQNWSGFLRFFKNLRKSLKKLKAIVIRKLLEDHRMSFKKGIASTVLYETKVCHSSGLPLRSLMTSHPQVG